MQIPPFEGCIYLLLLYCLIMLSFFLKKYFKFELTDYRSVLCLHPS